MLSIDAVRAAHVCSGFMVMRFFGDMKKMPWALCFGDIDSNLICLEALEGEISNLVAWKVRRLLQAGFHLHNIKRGLMLMREISWSMLPVEQAHGSTGSIHKLHPMMGSEVISRRSMLHMSRALFFPDAEDRCAMNLQKGHRAIATKTATEDVGEASVLSCADARGQHSSQALKGKLWHSLSSCSTRRFRRLTSRVGTRWPQNSRAGTLATSSRCAAQCGRD